MPDATPPVLRLNGIDLRALERTILAVRRDPALGAARFHVSSAWRGQTRSEARIESCTLGGEAIVRPFSFTTDTPFEMLGTDTAPNPQEHLLAAFNACLMVGYVVHASLEGVTLEKLEIETEGEIDLRGLLGLDDAVNPGYDRVCYRVRLRGDGSPERMQRIHDRVRRSSPNIMSLARPVQVDAEIEIEPG